MKRRLSTILFGVVFIAGLSLLLYPTVSDYWNSFHQSRAIASYVDAVDNTDEQKLDEMRKAAQASPRRSAEGVRRMHVHGIR